MPFKGANLPFASLVGIFCFIFAMIIFANLKNGGSYMEAIKTFVLSKRYGDVTAADRVSLEISRGELFALLGVNGAGKTTMIKMLTGLTAPSSGEAYVGGHCIKTEMDAVKALIGVSPQETAVAPNLSVEENLMFLCRIHGFSKAAAKERTEELKRKFSLDTVFHRKAGTLSGGWQRRLSIAMALVNNPRVLFLDEPTLGLDVIARHELWDVIRALKGNTTVILTTHYMEEAEALSDRIGIMKNGRLLGVGTAQALKQKAGTDRFEEAFVAIVKEEM